MIVAVSLSHGIRIDILDKMANFNNLTEIEALEKVKICIVFLFQVHMLNMLGAGTLNCLH